MTPRSRSNSISSPAVESVVDAHASRILRINSPAESRIDPALGPYVTSILRCALAQDSSVELDDIEEVDSLLELLQEHCTMDTENARNVLFQIYMTVKTGTVEDIFAPSRSTLGRPRPRFRSEGNEEDAIRLLGQMLRGSSIASEFHHHKDSHVTQLTKDFQSNGNLSPELDIEFTFDADDLLNDNQTSMEARERAPFVNHTTRHVGEGNAVLSVTPLKPTTLIPTDLLGVLDNPTTPAPPSNLFSSASPKIDLGTMETPKICNGDKHKAESEPLSSTVLSSPSPPLSKESNISPSSKESIAQDLAATLFKATRSRSNSILSDRSPKFKPMQATHRMPSSPGQFSLNDYSNQQLLESTVQMLLSLNSSLSEEAAINAAQVTDNDVNVAQYVIEKALKAPPVCRHMLNNSCYRSDCQFSHDVEGHTCLFWLKGRCGKGTSCRFLHGFSEHLLDGMVCQKAKHETRSQNIPITTTNLVQHNLSSSPRPFSFMPSSMESKNSLSAEEAFGGGAYSLSIRQSAVPQTPISTPIQPSVLTTSMMQNGTPTHPEAKTSENHSFSPDRRPLPEETASRPKTFSFASIASKGYKKESSFTVVKEKGSVGANTAKQNKSIPQSIAANANANAHANANANKGKKTARIPPDLSNIHYNRNSFSHVSDPMERYLKVASSYNVRSDVIDLHFQSIKSFPGVLSRILPEKLQKQHEIWILTGSGNHHHHHHHNNNNNNINNSSSNNNNNNNNGNRNNTYPQRSGGVLETAVIRWLSGKGYEYVKGKDKNGCGGAVLVKGRR